LNSFVCGAESPVAVCALPKRQGDRNGIDVDPIPPCRFITMPVKFAMVKSTNRYRELITDFAAQRTRLCEAKMVRCAFRRCRSAVPADLDQSFRSIPISVA
jgi:hypothetical protein